ncbi:MAG TPA: hypothetical protein VHS28_03370 [Chloroflexota bacterium]|nr:hypothetical protein [Chloroflexota bacterium]
MKSRIPALEMCARSDAVRAARSTWEDLLRPACETLCRTSAGLMRTVIVCGRLDGGDEELLLLLAQTGELATEYGLASVIGLDGMKFSVVFSRDDGRVHAVREDR